MGAGIESFAKVIATKKIKYFESKSELTLARDPGTQQRNHRLLRFTPKIPNSPKEVQFVLKKI